MDAFVETGALVTVFVVVLVVLVVLVLVFTAPPVAGAAGTSCSCGWVAVSLPTIARSRFNVVSLASAESFLFSPPLHAARSATIAIAIGAATLLVYFTIWPPE